MTAPLVQRVGLVLEYHVVFTRGAFDPANPLLADTLSRRERRRHRVAVVIDDGVASRWPALVAEIERYAARHADRIELVGSPWVVAGGETAKQERQLAELHRRLAAHEIDRHSYVLAIGGGAMLDVVGYAAATLHRGVRLVRMPTTVLATERRRRRSQERHQRVRREELPRHLRGTVRGDQRQRASCRRCSGAIRSLAWPRRSRSR